MNIIIGYIFEIDNDYTRLRKRLKVAYTNLNIQHLTIKI